MLVLLPPSETKRPGGEGPRLDVRELAFASLNPVRRKVIAALVALSADEDAAVSALRLGPKQRHEIALNRSLRRAPTMPAVDRYTGVLFDALDAVSLDDDERAWLGEHVAIHSAPFGPVGALDPIPAYRLAAGASIPGLPPLRRLWGAPVAEAIARADPAFVLDLRSEAYASLGPVPAGLRSAYVRVVAESDEGTTRALNHFNKHAKGALVRRMARDRVVADTPEALLDWAAQAGVRMSPGREPGEWDLVETAESVLRRRDGDR